MRHKKFWANKLVLDFIYTSYYSSNIYTYLLKLLFENNVVFTFVSNLIQFVTNTLSYFIVTIFESSGKDILGFYTHTFRKYRYILYLAILTLSLDIFITVPLILQYILYPIFIGYMFIYLNFAILVNFILFRSIECEKEQSRILYKKTTLSNIFSIVISIVLFLLTFISSDGISILLVFGFSLAVMSIEYRFLRDPSDYTKSSISDFMKLCKTFTTPYNFKSLSYNAKYIFLANNLQNGTYFSNVLEFAYFFNMYTITAKDLFMILIIKQISALICSVLFSKLHHIDSKFLLNTSRILPSIFKYALILLYLDKNVIYLVSIIDGAAFSATIIAKDKLLLEYVSKSESKSLNAYLQLYHSFFAFLGSILVLPLVSGFNIYLIFSISMLMRASTWLALRPIKRIDPA